METTTPLNPLLELPYRELEELNRKARELSDSDLAQRRHTAYLEREDRIQAITIGFSDIEGRLHTLDYDKQFFLNSIGSLTFDGSSIRGFSELHESDLRLIIDWTSFTFLPADVFGAGQVLLFANIGDRDLKPYPSDFRGRLQAWAAEMKESKGYTAYMAPEIEGLLIDGQDAEQNYEGDESFQPISTGGYYHALPLDPLRIFIDKTASALRAMGFKNEKDHPEVAPSQFEINYSYTDAVRAADQVLLYKLTCRQIANSMGMTASFLPKPMQGVNGNGMHTNISVAQNGTNLFYSKNGRDGLSDMAHDFIQNVLSRAEEICLVLNSSVNAYRRLDPNFEAPNQIKFSANDRGSMIRVPLAGEKSARIEVRSVAPDANPYLLLLSILQAGLQPERGDEAENPKGQGDRFLPGSIDESMYHFNKSEFMTKVLGKSSKLKYLNYKTESADRNPRLLGNAIKPSEILYHHEVVNQYLESQF